MKLPLPTPRWTCTSIAALTALTLSAPMSAEAQDRVGITLNAGGVFATDSAPAEQFSAPLVIGTVQRVMKRYFVLEGELAYWGQTTRSDFASHDIQGPGGVIGRVGHTTVLDNRKNWNLGLNFLVRSTGALRVFGGAGASLAMQDTEYSQIHSDCSVPSEPRVCDRHVTARVRGPLPVIRGLGGIEVPIRRSLAIVGTVRAELSTWEERRNVMSASAGIRFSLK